jgi:hypothetical protein
MGGAGVEEGNIMSGLSTARLNVQSDTCHRLLWITGASGWLSEIGAQILDFVVHDDRRLQCRAKI